MQELAATAFQLSGYAADVADYQLPPPSRPNVDLSRGWTYVQRTLPLLHASLELAAVPQGLRFL